MMIETENICKSYGKIQAVKSWSISVKANEIYGLIGPDGAGKTTLFRLLTTVLLPDSGKGVVAGYDIVKDFRQIRKEIGYMPGRFSLYEDLTVKENLQFFATVFSTTIEENMHLIKDIYSQLEKFSSRKAGKLSGGMKQKLALCCALIHSPKVLFLDEPTTGVDVVSRREFWQMLKRLKQEGITIIVSTPYMDEAEMCDSIALVNQGEFLRIDTPNGIVSSFDKTLFSVKSNKMHQLLNDLKQYSNALSAFSFGESIHLKVNSPTIKQDLSSYLSDKGHSELEIQEIKPNIEDCFMAMTSM